MTRMTAADLSKVLTREGYKTTLGSLCLRAEAAATICKSKDRMNGTEAEYAMLLEYRKRAGEIRDYRFESVKLRLADRTWYTPDFEVEGIGGDIAYHEVKGHWEDDARVKIKVAAEQYPRRKFIAVSKIPKKKGGGWKVEEFR